MKHTWGPERWRIKPDCHEAICACCGLRRWHFKTIESRTGWLTLYRPADLETPGHWKKAPACEKEVLT